MDRPTPPPNQKFRSESGHYVFLIVVCVGLAAYWGGLVSGAIHCGHRCYWCGKQLEPRP